MAESAGVVALDLELNQSGFNSQLSGIGKMAKKVGATLASAFAIKKTFDFGKQCIELGSDLAEVQNVVDVAFPKMSGTIDKFAKNAASQFGLSETMAKRYAGTFGSMSKAFGFSEKEAAEMSTTLTGLSGDVASFYNISQDEAYTKLKSVFTGETESLKDLGVVMTQTALDQFALQNGFGKTTAKMTEQEKVALRYAFVQKQLTDASGDFARTSDSWANQTRLLSLQFDSLRASIGQGLINVFTPVIKLVNTLMGKLTTLAGMFKSFTDMITGNKSDDSSTVQSTSNELSDVASNADEATSGMNGLTDSTKKAAKAAKGLAGFDELNVLQQNDSDSGTSGSGSGTASASGASAVKDITPNVDAGNGALGTMNKWLDKIFGKFKKLAGLFKTGFTLGFKSKGLDVIKNALINIGKNIKEIFTDKKVLDAASNWADSIALSVGKIVGSIASIGISIATMLIGGIDKFFEQNKDYLKDKIVEMLNISAERAEIFANFCAAVADIFTVFESDDAQQIVADVLAIFTTVQLELYVLCQKIGRDIMQAITTPIVENTDTIKTALMNTIKPIETAVSGIKTFVQEVFANINSMYDQYIKPAFDNIGSGLSKIFDYVLDGYNSFLAPVFSRIASELSSLLNTYISPMFNSIFGFIGRVFDVAGKLFNFLSPIIGWFIEKAMPQIAFTIETTWNKIQGIISVISVVITTLMNVINGLIDFVVGVFTGDWKKAWNGIKNVFKSVFDGIKSIINIAMDFVKNTIVAICSKVASYIKVVVNGIYTVMTTGWTAIKNVFSGVIGFFKGVFSGAWNAIKSIFSNPGAFFKNVWNGIKGSFGHVSGWFKDTFSKAWQAVKDVFSTGGKVFSGIKAGIASVFKSVVNSLIGGINKVVAIPFDKINGMLNNIRAVKIMKWKPFEKMWGHNPLPVPQIPKMGGVPALAEGAVLKPNAPFLAMVGDQKHGTNIESPLSTIVDAFRQVQGENATGISDKDLLNAISNMQVNVIVQQDSRGVFNMVKQEVVQEQRRTGKPVWT